MPVRRRSSRRREHVGRFHLAHLRLGVDFFGKGFKGPDAEAEMRAAWAEPSVRARVREGWAGWRRGREDHVLRGVAVGRAPWAAWAFGDPDGDYDLGGVGA